MISKKKILFVWILLVASSRLVAEDPAIKTAYLGVIDAPPFLLGIVTGCPQGFGDDGMPIVMSVQIEASSVTPDAFRVHSRNGVISTPNCATLQPADESNELHTILLAGPIADPDDLPDRVEIVGAVKDINGNLLTGLVSPPVIIGANIGPSLVYAYLIYQPGGPAGSSSTVVQLVWEGGVTGPNGAEPGTDQLNSIRIIDCNGNVHSPLSFDDLGDGDNYVEIYIPTGVAPSRIEVDAGFFYDPLNVPNPATDVKVTSLLPPAEAKQLQLNVPEIGFNRVNFSGTPEVPYRIFFSRDLATWDCLGSVTADSSSGNFHYDFEWSDEEQSFYLSAP
jgi:hypothetical protein